MSMFLVTGGAGFIGSHLADALLARGHSVRILDDLSTGRRANVPAAAEFVVGDVAHPVTVARAAEGVAACFHLAAVASVERANRDWLGVHRVNLSGTIAVLDAARRGGFPVVYASSAAVYGDNPDLPLSEASRVRPLSAYGADKLGCELHARAGGRVHGIRTAGLRFFNVYGPRQDPSSPYSGVISIFCDRIKAGQEATIFGDGGQSRDFVFVGDVVRAIVSALDAAATDAPVFNVCTGRGTTVRDLAEAVAAGLGVPARIGFAPARNGDIRVSLGTPALAKASLGWEARIELREGLAATLADS